MKLHFNYDTSLNIWTVQTSRGSFSTKHIIDFKIIEDSISPYQLRKLSRDWIKWNKWEIMQDLNIVRYGKKSNSPLNKFIWNVVLGMKSC